MAQFRHSADEAAAAARKAKSSGQKGGKGSKGPGGPKDSKSSAGTMAKFGSGKGTKRMGKKAGLAKKPRWDSTYKIPKRPAPATSVSSGARTPRKADKHRHLKRKVTEKGSMPNKGSDPKVKTGGGGGRQFRSLRLSQTCSSTTGPAITQGMILCLPTLSALSGQVVLCSFEAPGTFR